MELAAALVGHLVWPTAAVTALLVLRKPIAARLKNLRSVKAGSFGAEFGEAERQVEQALEVEANRANGTPADALEAAQSHDLDGLTDGFKEIAQRASENPSYAVVASWTLLEHQIRSTAADVQPTDVRARVNPSRATRTLLEQGVISDETHEAITALRHLRNEVAHGLSAPEAGAAVGYVRSVDEVARLIYRRLALLRRLRRLQEDRTSPRDHSAPITGTESAR
jgi:hypothetical protein